MAKNFSHFIAVLAFLSTGTAYSLSPECEPYSNVHLTSDLTTEWLDMNAGVNALDPTFRDSRRHELQRALIQRLRAQLDRDIPAPLSHCKTQIINRERSRIQISLMGGGGTQTTRWTEPVHLQSLSNLGSLTRLVRNTYSQSPCVQPSSSNPDPSEWPSYYECWNTNGPQNLNNVVQALSTMTGAQLRQEMTLNAIYTYPDSNLSSQFSALNDHFFDIYRQVFILIATSNSEQDLLHTVQSQRTSSMSWEDRAIFTSVYLGILNGYYSDTRNGVFKPEAAGADSLRELHQNIRQNFLHDSDWYNSDYPNPYSADRGVCRDLASTGGELLRAQGFDNVYAVVSDMGGEWHVFTVASVPGQPNVMYSINYSNLDRLDNAQSLGPAALDHAGWIDATPIVHRIYLPAGRMLTTVPSLMGQVMYQFAGLQNPVPFAQSQPGIQIAAVNFGATQTELRFGLGQDQQNNLYYGMTLGQAYNQGPGSRNPGRVGITFLSRTYADQLLHMANATPNDPLHSDVLYLHLEQELNSKNISLANGNIQMLIRNRAQFIFNVSRLRGPDPNLDGNVGGNVDIRLQSGLEVQHGNPWLDRFSATYRAEIQSALGTYDIRNQRTITPALFHHLLFNAEGRMRLSQSSEGRAFLIAGTSVVVDLIGVRQRSYAGVLGARAAGMVTFESPIAGFRNDPVPVWQPAGVNRLGLNLTVSPTGNQAASGVQLSLQGSTTTDRDLERDFQVRGNVTVRGDLLPAQRTRAR